MNSKRTAQSAFFNLRVLLGVLVGLTGVILALLGFGTFAVPTASSTQAQQSYTADSFLTVNGQLSRTVDLGSETPRWILRLEEPFIYGKTEYKTIEVDLQGKDLEKLKDKKVHIMGRIESRKGRNKRVFPVLRADAITLGDNRPTDSAFYIHDLGHRCWDFGAEASWAVGKPVYIYSCNGSVAQQVRVRETDSHDVHLGVRSLFCIGVRGGKVIAGAPLELQVCDDTSPAQRFAVDGDAVLMGSQTSGMVTREFVIAPQFYHTPSTTPLVVSVRQVSDAEYFRFEAVDRSGAPPTSGFRHILTEAELDADLALGWGTVIEVDPAPLELKGQFPKPIHSGVTLRGYRKYTFQGPEVHTCTTTDQPMFVITEDNVRITGLRLRGPFNDPRCQSSNVSAQAILIQPTAEDVPHVPIVLVDHLDVGYFTASAVDTRGTDPGESPTCPTGPVEFPRLTPVRVIGNFIHHIEKRDPFDSYGSVTGQGAFILNQGNIFYQTYAHSIAADPTATTGYHAYDNFFLSNQRKTHVVDMHPTGHAEGTRAGDYFDVGWNTFLPTGHENIHDSGTPCRFTAIHHNIFLQSESEAIVTATKDLAKHVVYANTFNAQDEHVNPISDLAVGDFDGDGTDDVFVGTGAAWYFSSGAASEWRFLNRMPERASSLLFGDFDGDGRTDIIALHAGNIDVSWGAMSPWQTINSTTSTLADLAVGDFDGDRHADLLLATGTEWFWAPGGKNWISLGPSSDRRAQLLFGDFRHAGHTQILRIHSGHWELGEIVSGTLIFTTLNGPAQADSVDGLVVGDFDGTGFADEVARTNPQTGAWEYTRPSGFPTFADWRPLRNDPGAAGTRLAKRGVAGRFLGGAFTDIVVWQGVDFYVAPSARDPLRQISRQDMR
jgi:hypothetical protein